MNWQNELKIIQQMFDNRFARTFDGRPVEEVKSSLLMELDNEEEDGVE